MSSKIQQLVQSVESMGGPSPELLSALESLARPGIVRELEKCGHVTEALQDTSTADLARLLLASG